MRSIWQQTAVLAVLAVLGAGSLLAGSPASAQTTSATQVLDRVHAVSPRAVLDMSFDDPAQADPFETPPEITTTRGFTSCQLTSKRGLFCLDRNSSGAPGRFVRRWNPVFANSEVGSPYFSCESLPGVDTSKSVETCTGITADENGAVVVAGKRKGGYNLVKVAPRTDVQDGNCTTDGWAPLPSGQGLCYKVLLPRDRPLLVDLTYAELTLPNGVQCTGILGLENRTTLMFFTDRDAREKNHPSCEVTYAETAIVGAREWGLQRGEMLQGATVVKTKNGDSFALVISNFGRVLAKKTNDSLSSPFPLQISRGTAAPFSSVVEVRSSRTEPAGTSASQCDGTAQEFGIRVSTKSGRLYVTDKNYCEVSAFEPAADTLTSGANGLAVVQFVGRDLVLSTKAQPSGTAYPALEPTLAPGISIDLSKCASEGGCTLVAASDGIRAATLSNVKLASQAKGMTLFQIRDLPDCRWIQERSDPEVCPHGAVSGVGPPWKQYLNLKPLLPREVADQLAPEQQNDMYISPQYRAQEQNGFRFEAFFGITQEGVIFQDVFNLEFEPELSARDNYACNAAPAPGTPVGELLEWDISVTVSEKVRVVGASGRPYVDMLVNNGCGSTRAGAVRWSAYTYDMELTPQAYNSESDGNDSPPQDYFAHLVVDLFFDLEDAREAYACPAGGELLGSAVCRDLESTWANARDKLTKCLTGSSFPRTSEAVRNCNSFDVQMANYRATLNTVPVCTATTTSCRDPDNRLGEIKARVDTLRHVLNARLIPSIPEDGWNPAFEGIVDGILMDPHPSP